MRNLFLLLFLWAAAALSPAVHAQTTTQTVRGTVLGAAAKAPVIGATVVVPGVEPALGASTDADGRFRLAGVPVGRVRLRITSVGYEDLFLNEVTVSAGKKVVLDLSLTERLTNLDEVTVLCRRSEDRTVPNNEMATVSARPFSPLEANRYAGSLGDPARMAQNFAGVGFNGVEAGAEGPFSKTSKASYLIKPTTASSATTCVCAWKATTSGFSTRPWSAAPPTTPP